MINFGFFTRNGCKRRVLKKRHLDADGVVFTYIQKRIKEFHKTKSKFESKLQTKYRKHKAIDTNPLKEPLKNWDSLTIKEKYEAAVMMIDAVYVSDEDGSMFSSAFDRCGF